MILHLYWANMNDSPARTNVYDMVVQCSQMFAIIKHSIKVFNEHVVDVCEDSSKSEKRLCLVGTRADIVVVVGHRNPLAAGTQVQVLCLP